MRQRSIIGGIAILLLTAPTVPALTHAAPALAHCAALGRYTILANPARYALNAPLPSPFPTVTGGTATIARYTACGTPTLLTLTTSGAGSVVTQPVAPLIGYRLETAGDLLLRFSGTARQDPMAVDPRAVRLSGTAVYVLVTTRGRLHGTHRLAYRTIAVPVTNVPAQLKVTTDLTGAFSLSCALPGPRSGTIQSAYTYYAVGVRTPAKLGHQPAPSRNI